MKRIHIAGLSLILAIATSIAYGIGALTAADATDTTSKTASIVGAWEVQAIGAPFAPHLFTFTADGNVFTTNPTNVQEDPSAPHGGTNDSVGMGPYRRDAGKSNVFVGTFYQLNANADDHSPADTLSVTFRVTVRGDTFDGNAIAFLGDFSAPAQLVGKRLKIKEDALPGL